jgi:hypothetical protein
MGLFSDNELSIKQIENLNNILLDKFRKQVWLESDFKGESSLFNRLDESSRVNSRSFDQESEKLKGKKDSLPTVAAMNIKIFNTVPFDAEQLGMIDVGVTTKFGASSTGDRFANGFVGYAIESAMDDAWAKNNLQDNAVSEVKLKLLEKARMVYPSCNLIFNYDVDFREIGSSGNVFIYMRGTAAVGENSVLVNALEEAKKEIEDIERNLKIKKESIEHLQEVKGKIPKSPKEIKKFLGE